MERRLYELFDNITPSQSSEELLCAVLGKAEKTMDKKRLSKKFIIIPAAAAVLAAGTIGVGAAYDWDISQAFDRFFSHGSSAVQDIGSGFDFTEAGKPIGITLSAEHCDITVNGILAGEKRLYMLYDVEFEEGFDCATALDADWSNWLFDVSLSVNGGEHFHGSCFVDDISGSRYTLCGSWELNEDSFREGDKLSVSFDKMYRYGYSAENLDKTEETVFTDIGFDTLLDVEVMTEGRVIDVNKTVEVEGHSAVLESISITPFDVSCQLQFEEDPVALADAGIDYVANVSYTDISGVTAEVDGCRTGSCSSDGAAECKMEWNYPVNVEDIASVTLYGITVPLK